MTGARGEKGQRVHSGKLAAVTLTVPSQALGHVLGILLLLLFILRLFFNLFL